LNTKVLQGSVSTRCLRRGGIFDDQFYTITAEPEGEKMKFCQQLPNYGQLSTRSFYEPGVCQDSLRNSQRNSCSKDWWQGRKRTKKLEACYLGKRRLRLKHANKTVYNDDSPAIRPRHDHSTTYVTIVGISA